MSELPDPATESGWLAYTAFADERPKEIAGARITLAPMGEITIAGLDYDRAGIVWRWLVGNALLAKGPPR